MTGPWVAVAPYGVCAAVYAVLTTLILVQARRSRTGFLLAGAVCITMLWAVAVALLGAPLQGIPAALDLLRILAWYGFCLHLYRQAMAPDRERLFTLIGGLAVLGSAMLLLSGRAGLDGATQLLSAAILLRLAIAISQMLVLENLYRSAAPDQRWHIGLACIALGGLAAYDVAVCADAALLRAASPTLVSGRAVVALLVAPLLAIAAARNRSWRIDIHLSRTAAFHSATLVVSGVFLLALAAAGETARWVGAPFGEGWGGLAEIGLVFTGVITIAVLLGSASARATLRHALADHFFTNRYDYRREWQRSIATLSAPSSGPLSERVIRALADPVESPAGLLFTLSPGHAELVWAGAWNTPSTPAIPGDAALAAALLAADGPLILSAPYSTGGAGVTFEGGFSCWLAIPLQDPGGRESRHMGYILLARPQTDFRLDAEVFDLLRILAHEVAIHLAQERAASTVLQTRDLRAYGERFAFVAHDIKNVSSQLTLLLSNAETYLSDPEFQRDMLATVRAAAGRIGGLIRRLEPGQAGVPAQAAEARMNPLPDAPMPETPMPATPMPAAPMMGAAEQITAMLTARRHGGSCRFTLAAEAWPGGIAMDAAEFHAAVTHLLDNAGTAAGPQGLVHLTLKVRGRDALLDIADDGPGMSAEFIRDELFTPFATRTAGGSGIGAFQARELVRAAGGALTVLSRPGQGTVMRLVLPVAAGPFHESDPAPRDHMARTA